MITLSTTWWCWVILVANVFMVGACAGLWDALRITRRRASQRQGKDT